MKPRTTQWFVALIVTVGVVETAPAQSPTISAFVFGAGGGSTGNTTHRLVGTVAQPVIGFAQNGMHTHGAGFWYISRGFVTSVPAGNEVIPTDFQLAQNYPNPFNPSTIIRYGLPHTSIVQLAVFNALGQQVAVLQKGKQEPGYHEIRFEARGLSSGVYFYRIQAGSFTETKRFLLVR